ncbi:Autophagy-related protein 18a [Histomonas meleagridis]|uniref:Autophagy-related protein 18a n=1 Tax=Histomonas meleagridis TaxID=135588 RepID=UPI00355A3C94|nr:Autophagy-related protein 18a [Histomonas meleagridis]KAH0807121.1 Autophagy-related protein 18a [Histomonas meleagridis]
MPPKIRSFSFDQRNEQIGLAIPSGFIIYECSSGVVVYEAKFPGGGANCLSILSDSNLVAASGDDSLGGFKKSTLILWDCKHDKVIRLIDFECDIDFLIFRSDCLVVVHGEYIDFYDCCDFEIIYTSVNPTPGKHCAALVQSNTLNLCAVPSPSGDNLIISDYHDPGYTLGVIPVQFQKVSFFSFDSSGELLATVLSEGKKIYLWSVLELKLIAKFKRGIHSAKISGIAFDHLSNCMVITTKRGTMHVFSIPNPAEREKTENIKSVRSKFNYDLPKGVDFHCQFDIAGFVLTGITDDGMFKQLRLDIDKGLVVPICDRKLEL